MAVTWVKQEVNFGWQHIKPKWGDIPGSGETNDCRRWLKHLDLTPKNEDAHSQPNVIFAFASRSDESRSRLVQSRAVVRVKNYIKRLKRSRLCAIFSTASSRFTAGKPSGQRTSAARTRHPNLFSCGSSGSVRGKSLSAAEADAA